MNITLGWQKGGGVIPFTIALLNVTHVSFSFNFARKMESFVFQFFASLI